jgi:hypothetical protein
MSVDRQGRWFLSDEKCMFFVVFSFVVCEKGRAYDLAADVLRVVSNSKSAFDTD